MLAAARKAEESLEDSAPEVSEDAEEKVESDSSGSYEEDSEEVSSEDDSAVDSDEDIENGNKVKEENTTIQPSGSTIVESILARDAEALTAISVSKVGELRFDLGRLEASDTDLDLRALRKSQDEYLLNLARDNTQLLINKIWELPISREGTDILAKLPAPVQKCPREKPIPKPKVPTKWEKFALEKGISKKKRGKLRWDEELKKWIPWYGYKRAQAEKEKNWVAEVRDKDDPNQDPFMKKKAEKKERIAKNEYQRLRNIAAGNNLKIPRTVETQKKTELKKQKRMAPRMGFLTADKMDSEDMAKAITVAKSSTASVGVFQSKLCKEKTARATPLLAVAKKRKVPLKPQEEREKYLKMVDSMITKQPKIDMDRAVNKQFHEEERARAEEKKNQKPRGKGGRKGKSRGGGKGGKGGRNAGGGGGGGRGKGRR